MKNKTEVPGNVLKTGLNIQRVMDRTATALYRTDHRVSDTYDGNINLRYIRIKAPAHLPGQWFAVVAISTAEGPMVGFHTASSFIECLEGACNAINNNSMKWKEDQYA